MNYQATIRKGKVEMTFIVADCGWGQDWARTRAIYHFIVKQGIGPHYLESPKQAVARMTGLADDPITAELREIKP
jgi:hypothetical protein